MNRNRNRKERMKAEKKPEIRITELISVNSVGPARQLLKKHGVDGPVTSNADLENKLIQLFRNTTDKKAMEKEMAEIHPHKDFIMRNCTPEIKETKEVVSEPLIREGGKMTVVDNGYSDFEGEKEKKSCACGCQHSNFAGPRHPMDYYAFSGPQANQSNNNQTTTLAIFGMVAIVGLIIYKHSMKTT